MGLSAAEIEAHIAQWEQTLGRSYQNYRSKWPSRLFHHAPVENAVRILRAGQLLSRNDVRQLGVRDVASQEVVNSRADAHAFARLYFRPRTPTQFHIEGVRKPQECYRGEISAHAPILVMLVFSARSVLALRDCQFSTGNMQSHYVTSGSSAQDFAAINFSNVYHDGGTGGDHAITTARCAEVLAPSPLAIADHLQFILCRSQAERTFLLHLLGEDADRWADLIRVSDDMQVFQKEYCYVEEVSLSTRGVTFRLHPRRRDAPVRVQVEARELSTGHLVAQFGPAPLNAVPGDGKTKWITPSETALPPGNYGVKLWLEDHLAFEAELSLSPSPF